jgi:hypothetical protein
LRLEPRGKAIAQTGSQYIRKLLILKPAPHAGTRFPPEKKPEALNCGNPLPLLSLLFKEIPIALGT